jgi:hypothetical protein
MKTKNNTYYTKLTFKGRYFDVGIRPVNSDGYDIEVRVKVTLSGDDLDSALYEFADSFDSVLLKRSVSLLVEGLNAGGEIASLLNNIALNIQIKIYFYFSFFF